MIKKIVITDDVEIGSDKFKCSYTVGYKICGYTDTEMEYLEPIGWDETGMALDRNKIKYSLFDVLTRNIPSHIIIVDKRSKKNDKKLLSSNKILTLVEDSSLLVSTSEKQSDKLKKVSCEECGFVWFAKNKEIKPTMFCSDECKNEM